MGQVININRKVTNTREGIRQEVPNHPVVTRKPEEYWEQLELDFDSVS